MKSYKDLEIFNLSYSLALKVHELTLRLPQYELFSDKKYQNLRANNLAIWEGIKWYSQNGYKRFCFGRTEPDDQGLIQFKSGWGTVEQSIHYFKYDFRKKEFIKDSLEFKNIYHYVFKKMPAPLLNIVGSSLYRHVG